jgi:hypothetical protein
MCGDFAKMSRKRSQRTTLDEGSDATEDGTKTATEAVGDVPSKRKKNGTLKDKILAVVRNSYSLLGLQKIKRLLVEDYGLTENKAFNTNVNKAIKALVEANDENFGKIGGSSRRSGEQSISPASREGDKKGCARLASAGRRDPVPLLSQLVLE